VLEISAVWANPAAKTLRTSFRRSADVCIFVGAGALLVDGSESDASLRSDTRPTRNSQRSVGCKAVHESDVKQLARSRKEVDEDSEAEADSGHASDDCRQKNHRGEGVEDSMWGEMWPKTQDFPKNCRQGKVKGEMHEIRMGETQYQRS
jgi:hypothetical protein